MQSPKRRGCASWPDQSCGVCGSKPFSRQVHLLLSSGNEVACSRLQHHCGVKVFPGSARDSSLLPHSFVYELNSSPRVVSDLSRKATSHIPAPFCCSCTASTGKCLVQVRGTRFTQNVFISGRCVSAHLGALFVYECSSLLVSLSALLWYCPAINCLLSPTILLTLNDLLFICIHEMLLCLFTHRLICLFKIEPLPLIYIYIFYL